MLATTIDAVKAILRSDITIDVSDRTRLIHLLTRKGEPVAEERKPARLIRRKEAAARLGLSLRAYDKLVGTLGLRRKLPGRIRSCGISEADLENLVNGRTDAL